MSAISLHHSDCVAWLVAHAARIAAGEAEAFDSCVTDPPYHLTSIVRRFGKPGSAAAVVPEGGTGAYARASRGFMGKEWDGGDVALRPETWRAVFDCLKPGAHLVAFSGTRTYHRMACAIEDAGFEIRDQLAWTYGSGFPKSHDVSKAIDRHNGDVREKVRIENVRNPKAPGGGKDGAQGATQPFIEKALANGYHEIDGPSAASAAWQGWGTALKPAWEPICLARKPLAEKSVAAQVLATGTGAINVDACRVGFAGAVDQQSAQVGGRATGKPMSALQGRKDSRAAFTPSDNSAGRWPSNLCHDGSAEVVAGFPSEAGGQRPPDGKANKTTVPALGNGLGSSTVFHADSGSAARFFYSAKAGPLDRIGTAHATVKPVDLMRWLVRLITPPAGRVLEPFAGSGTTGIACMAEGFDCTMIELEADHVADIERKLAFLRGEGALAFVEHDRRRDERAAEPLGGLFEGFAA